MRDKFLPIGTVVLLKGGKKRAMITGFCSIAQENQEKIFDYSGCVYPEGYLSSNQVCLFDHDQIEKIFFVGFEDEEEKMFKDKLNKIVASIENEEPIGNIQTQTAPQNQNVPSSFVPPSVTNKTFLKPLELISLISSLLLPLPKYEVSFKMNLSAIFSFS